MRTRRILCAGLVALLPLGAAQAATVGGFVDLIVTQDTQDALGISGIDAPGMSQADGFEGRFDASGDSDNIRQDAAAGTIDLSGTLAINRSSSATLSFDGLQLNLYSDPAQTDLLTANLNGDSVDLLQIGFEDSTLTLALTSAFVDLLGAGVVGNAFGSLLAENLTFTMTGSGGGSGNGGGNSGGGSGNGGGNSGGGSGNGGGNSGGGSGNGGGNSGGGSGNGGGNSGGGSGNGGGMGGGGSVSPVPLPAGMWLLLSAIGTLGARRFVSKVRA